MAYPQLDLKNQHGTRVTLVTNLGELKIQCFDDLVPKTVHNFVELCKKSYYDGQIFHRVIKDFMIQGGDPEGNGTGGESIYGRFFEDEFSEELFNLHGALSMANAGPNTNGSQFFIVQAHEIPYTREKLVKGGWPEEIAEAYVKLGGTPHLDGHHSVFGQLIDEESYKTLDRIATSDTDFRDRPLNDIYLERAQVIEPSQKKLNSTDSDEKQNQINVGDIFEAEVIGIQKYGVFVKFDKGKKGLVHISELQSGFVTNVYDDVKVGEKMQVQVIDRDEYSGKISLSVRSLEEHPKNYSMKKKHFFTDSRQKIGFKTISKEIAGWTRQTEKYLKEKN